jgi:hypothetical protein
MPVTVKIEYANPIRFSVSVIGIFRQQPSAIGQLALIQTLSAAPD